MLNYEKETTGLYISGHPMAEYVGLSKQIKAAPVSDLLEAAGDEVSPYKDGAVVKVFGIISSVKKKITKNDSTMAFVTVEDITSSIEVIVFPKVYERYANMLSVGSVTVIKGRLSLRDDEDSKIVADSFEPCPKEEKKAKKSGMFLRFGSENDPRVKAALNILDGGAGAVPVYFFFSDKKKYVNTGLTFSGDDERRTKLCELLGEGNVVIQ